MSTMDCDLKGGETSFKSVSHERYPGLQHLLSDHTPRSGTETESVDHFQLEFD